MREIYLEKNIKKILDILNENGEGYIVGGYVRDSLLGLTPKDADFCTNISYEKLKDIFKKYSPKEFGKSFGVLQIFFKGKSYEIAKYRKESRHTEDRKVFEVDFIESIEEDLKRRDFTINAIAYNLKGMKYVDGALEDIEKRQIRFIGDGEERIKEDPLRILRGVRIAITKNLFIEENTKRQLKKGANLLKNLSVERVKEEFFKILKSESSLKGLELLFELNCLKYFFPELEKVFEEKSNFEKIKNLKGDLEKNLIIIFLLTKNKGYENLKISKKIKNKMEIVVENFDEFDKIESKYILKKFLGKVGKENFLEILEIKKYLFSESYDDIERFYREVEENCEPYQVGNLKLKWKDIQEFGFEDEEEIKSIREKLLERVILNPLENKKEKLKRYIEEEM